MEAFRSLLCPWVHRQGTSDLLPGWLVDFGGILQCYKFSCRLKPLQQGVQMLQCHCGRAENFAASSKWIFHRSRHSDFMKAFRSCNLE